MDDAQLEAARAAFRNWLETDRQAAAAALCELKVQQWLNDGPAEIVRCLANWIVTGIDLSDDACVTELAEAAGFFEEEEHG